MYIEKPCLFGLGPENESPDPIRNVPMFKRILIKLLALYINVYATEMQNITTEIPYIEVIYSFICHY